MLIAPAVVTYSWLQQRKRAVKKEVKWKMIAGIDKSELVILKFGPEAGSYGSDLPSSRLHTDPDLF